MSRIATVRYTGNLHSDLTHLQSGNVISTDAPTDNNGRGEAFSPTDLLAASLGACAMTIMGMKAAVDFYLSKDLDERSRKLLEAAAHTCPVAQSLSAELVQELRFHYE